MASIRRIGPAFALAVALGLPVAASANQTPSPLCDGEKMKEKEPTAEKGESKPDQSENQSGKKSNDKPAPKPDTKEAGKS